MSGPIVRTGATPEFWENWDQIFGKKKARKATSTKKTAKKPSRTKKGATASSKKAAVKKKSKK